jgi:hypothetical protein
MGLMGSLHILLLDRGRATESGSFAPYQSAGGAVGAEKIHGQDRLKQYLRRSGIHEEIIEKALRDIQRDGRGDLPHLSIE